MDKEINDRSINPLIRIADAIEEILRLVKADQEKYTAREAREKLQSEN
jgi:ABC-type dipeptide/oligopeptide/nickel transport system ATPase component